MATYQAIAATSNAVRVLLENAAATSEWSDTTFELFQADKLQDPIVDSKSRVSIYLHRVVMSTARRDRGPRIAPDGRIFQPSLPVDLHYLVTAWSDDAVTAHRLLGWTFTVLQDTPVIPAALLNAYQAGVFEEQETVEFVWNPLPPADLSDLWQVASIRQTPSGSYIARAIRLDSTVVVENGPPVEVRRFDYAGGDSMTVPASVETIERLAHRNAISLRFRDVHTGEPVTDGLAVHVGIAHSDRSFPAVRTPSGAFTVRSLPGLGPWQTRRVDEAGVEDVVTVAAFPVTVDVRDELGRYLPFVIETMLPLDGPLGPDPGSPLSSAAGDELGIPLYTAPGRPVPAGMAVVRASLVTPGGEPAAHAALEVATGSAPVRGIADDRGQVAVLFAYPSLRRPLDSPLAGAKRSLSSVSWMVELQAYVPRQPPGSPPDLNRLIDQRPVTLTTTTSPITLVRHAEVSYGRECVLRSSATHAELTVGS